MVGRSGYGGHNHKKYYYYSCKDTHGKHVCPMKDVPKDLIEEAIIRILREKVLLDQEMREYFTDAILGYVNGENPEIPALKKNLMNSTRKSRNWCSWPRRWTTSKRSRKGLRP